MSEADETAEVTVTPVDGLRPDSGVIERADEVVRVSLLEVIPKFPGSVDAVAQYVVGALATAGLLTPSDTFASTKPSDADVALMRRAAASERAAERHWPADMLAQAADTIERLRTDLAANPDADVAERIVRALEEAAEKHPNPIVRLNLSDAADIARSHATPPVTTEQEIESLAAEIHEAYTYQYDECDHGTYTGGAMHGEPYSMCRINAERIIRRRSNPPVAATGEEADRG